MLFLKTVFPPKFQKKCPMKLSFSVIGDGGGGEDTHLVVQKPRTRGLGTIFQTPELTPQTPLLHISSLATYF